MGLQDTIWCMRTAPEFDKEWRLFAVFCARSIEHLLKDPRSITAINVAERFAYGTATLEELNLANRNATVATASFAAYVSDAYVSDAASFTAYAADDDDATVAYLTDLFSG